jgi:hypothetical protein
MENSKRKKTKCARRSFVQQFSTKYASSKLFHSCWELYCRYDVVLTARAFRALCLQWLRRKSKPEIANDRQSMNCPGAFSHFMCYDEAREIKSVRRNSCVYNTPGDLCGRRSTESQSVRWFHKNLLSPPCCACTPSISVHTCSGPFRTYTRLTSARSKTDAPEHQLLPLP